MTIDMAVPNMKVGNLPKASLARPTSGPDEDGEQTGDQVDRRQVRDVDPEIVDGIGAAERHQHVAAGREQGGHPNASV